MKILTRLFILVLFSMVFLLPGCFTFNQVGSPGDGKIELTNADSDTVTERFEDSKTVNHFIFGLISPSDSGLEELINKNVKMKKGKGAVNVKIKYQQTFVYGLVGMLTFGIYNPFELSVEGDVIK